MYEFRKQRIYKPGERKSGSKNPWGLPGGNQALSWKKALIGLACLGLFCLGVIWPSEDIGFSGEFERSRAISQMLADRRDGSGDSAIIDKVEGRGLGGSPTAQPKDNGGAKQERPGAKLGVVPKPTPGKNVPASKSSLSKDRKIPKSEYLAAELKLALAKDQKKPVPKPEPKGKVDVPNGKLKDPIPLPTGEMCELKPTIVKGKVIDQWKVDNSRKFWAFITKLGWNQPDRVRALMTFTMEGSFDPKARGDHDNGGSGGMCGLHFKWQKPFLVAEGVMTGAGKLLPKFDDLLWQFGACASRYAGGTKFYGYRNDEFMDDHWVVNKITKKKRLVPGKRTKATNLLKRITCK